MEGICWYDGLDFFISFCFLLKKKRRIEKREEVSALCQRVLYFVRSQGMTNQWPHPWVWILAGNGQLSVIMFLQANDMCGNARSWQSGTRPGSVWWWNWLVHMHYSGNIIFFFFLVLEAVEYVIGWPYEDIRDGYFQSAYLGVRVMRAVEQSILSSTVIKKK